MFLACLFNAALIQTPLLLLLLPPLQSIISVHLFIITRFVAEKGEGEEEKEKRNVIDWSGEEYGENYYSILSLSLSLSRFKREERRNSLRISSIDLKIVFDVELSLEREISMRFFFFFFFFAS